jgi:polyisoprenoid-binding protein YceI
MKSILTSLAALLLAAAPAFAADDYKVDPVHSTVLFRVGHANIGQYWGRFNDPTGTFTLDDADPTKSRSTSRSRSPTSTRTTLSGMGTSRTRTSSTRSSSRRSRSRARP